MPSPAPSYDDQLALFSQQLLHPLADHPMAVTWACLASSTPSNYTTYANAIRDIFVGGFKSSFDTSVTIGTLRVLFGHGDIFPSQGFSDDAPEAGTGGTNSEPVGIAAIVSERTADIGRRNRGRFYLPGVLDESQVDEGGNITSGRVTAIQTAANGFFNSLDAAGSPMVICNRLRASNPTPPPADYVQTYAVGSLVTALVIQPKIGYQRRRTGR